jgi:hypothetical protein
MKKLLLIILLLMGTGYAYWDGNTNVIHRMKGDIDTTELGAGIKAFIANHSGGGGGGEAFPVGAVFLSVVSTNPNTLLGYGTWEQIAQGQFLVGQTSGDADFDVAEETGGTKTHTHDSHTTDNARSGTGVTPLFAPETHNTVSHVPPYFVVYIFKRTE